MTRTVPALARTRPAMVEISVVLPAPLGPSRPKNSPSWTWSETPWRAVNDPNRLTTESMSRAMDLASRGKRRSRHPAAARCAPSRAPQPDLRPGCRKAGDRRRRDWRVYANSPGRSGSGPRRTPPPGGSPAGWRRPTSRTPRGRRGRIPGRRPHRRRAPPTGTQWPRPASPAAGPAPPSPLRGRGLGTAAAVALATGLDQARDSPLADDGRELVPIGLDQPDAEHVDVVDLPGVAGKAHPLVELDRLGAVADHFAAHDHVLVGRVGADRLHADRLVAHFRQ